MEKTKLIIVGAGGFGRELMAMIGHSTLANVYKLEGFVDDGMEPGTSINGLPLLGDVEWLANRNENIAVSVAIGNSKVRKTVVQKLIKNDSLEFPNIIHPSVHLHSVDYIKLGLGNIICDRTIVTTDVCLGNFNIINLSVTIGHDVQMGDFCSLMPSVNISGGCRLEDGVYIGSGAVVINASILEKACVIGAGSVVRTHVPSGKTFAGVPAAPIK